MLSPFFFPHHPLPSLAARMKLATFDKGLGFATGRRWELLI